MSRHLFLGGPWDSRVMDVEPLPYLVVPGGRGYSEYERLFAQYTYAAHRFWLKPPTFQHPSHTWWIYVTGPMPYSDHVLRLLYKLDVPPESR